MVAHSEAAAEEAGVPVLDRPEARGPWNVAFPLAMLAIMAAAIVQSCVPQAATPQNFDAVAAVRASNEKAIVALAAVSADATLAQVLPALNLMVINFKPGSAVIPADAGSMLKSAARVLSAMPAGTAVAIIGHTDSTGTAESNLALSTKRAEAMRDVLVSYGVAAERFGVSGAADARPVATNATEAGRFANRRIEFAEAAR